MPEYQFNCDADERLEWWVEDDSVTYDTGDVFIDRVLATAGVLSGEVLA